MGNGALREGGNRCVEEPSLLGTFLGVSLGPVILSVATASRVRSGCEVDDPMQFGGARRRAGDPLSPTTIILAQPLLHKCEAVLLETSPGVPR